MDGFELSILIDRPVEEAFEFLANLVNDVEWHSAYVEVRNMSDGRLEIGTRYLVYEGVFGRRTPATEYVLTEYELNRIVSWKTVSGPLQLKFWRTFERMDGSTRFSVRYAGQPSGFLKIVWPLLTRAVKRQQTGDMRKLKQLLETDGS